MHERVERGKNERVGKIEERNSSVYISFQRERVLSNVGTRYTALFHAGRLTFGQLFNFAPAKSSARQSVLLAIILYNNGQKGEGGSDRLKV